MILMRPPEPRNRFQSWRPLVLIHKRTKSSPSTLVRKMRSPHITGVEPPGPGMGNFQAMFFLSLHTAGSLVSLLTPLLSGPRQLGQLSARPAAAPAKNPPTA